MKSVYQQLQEITQFTSFAALIILSTTNQEQCFHIRDGPLENLWGWGGGGGGQSKEKIFAQGKMK